MKLRLALILAVVGLLASGLTVYAAPGGGNQEEYKVQAFGGDGPNPGSSAQLVRNNNGVNITIHTNNLPEGAYTLWAVIFNNPGECNTPFACNGSDVFNPDGTPNLGQRALAEISVLRVGGKVVNNGDNANFGGHVSANDTSEALFGNGLTNVSGAEIHFPIRYHGPVVPSAMPGLINSVGGGCNNFPCFDPQAAVPVS